MATEEGGSESVFTEAKPQENGAESVNSVFTGVKPEDEDEAESVFSETKTGSESWNLTLKVAMALMTVFFVLASIAQVSPGVI